MSRSNIFKLLGIVMMLSMLLAACQPTPAAETPAAVEPTTGEEVDTEEPATEEPATVERAPVIRFATLSDMTSTNVWYLYDTGGSSYWNYAPANGQWPNLYATSDQRLDWIPYLADGMPEEIVQEGDYYVGTVKMKDGLLWSDGSQITADDVVFTANTALKFQLQQNWLNAYDPNYLERVEAVDALTLKYYFIQKPGLPAWQWGALLGPIVNKAYWEPKVADLIAQVDALDATSDEFAGQLGEIVTTLETLPNDGEPVYGPFNMSKWEIGAFVETTANPNWHLTGVVVEEYANGAYREYKPDGSYDFVVYGDPTGDKVLELTNGPFFDSALYSLYDQDTAVLALRNDDVDFLLNPSGLAIGFVQQLQSDPSITITTNLQNGWRYMAFNQNRAYFAGDAGIALRQAVACMIDREFLSTRVLQGQVSPAASLVPEGNTVWYNPDTPIYCNGMSEQERMTEAVRILRDAGFTWTVEPAWNENRGGSVDYGEGLIMPDGTEFPEITLLSPSAGYDPLRATTAVYIEQWMRELGIPVTAELTNFNNILDAVYNTGDYDMFILGWGLSAFPSHLCTFFNSGDGTDSYGYRSERLAELCNQFYTESDFEKSKEIAFEIQVVLGEELPYIVLFTNPIYDAFRNLNYPYTEVFDGLGSALYGYPAVAMPASAQ